jgi:xanthosine phosphorylase
MSDYLDAAAMIRQRLPGNLPRIALVLGSGLGTVAERIEAPLVIPYEELPGFPRPTVQGHAGRLLIGTLNGVAVACMQGRSHIYEGHPPARIALPVHTLYALGCRTLLLTNAAGSLRRDMPAGSLMLITDHINGSGVNPLIGPNDDELGPRFFDMSEAYHPQLCQRLREAARETATELFEGVYYMVTGPNFETPAEIRAFARLGGDAVGMSTVPECLVANHCGMRVAGLSLITNLGAGLAPGKLDHAEVLSAGVQAAAKLAGLIAQCLPKLDA